MKRIVFYLLCTGILFSTESVWSQTLIDDINRTLVKSEEVTELFEFNSQVFFLKSDQLHGQELWKYDGDSAYIVIDLRPGPSSSGILELTVFNNELYFTASYRDSTSNIRSLWKTDGTAEGTQLVSQDVVPYYLCAGSSLLYFNGYDNVYGSELWATDGTSEGTFLVKDIMPGVNGSYPKELVFANGKCFFTAAESYNPNINFDREVYCSDGTEAGTVILDVPNPLPGEGSEPANLTEFKDEVYFFSYHYATSEGTTVSKALWKTDGTEFNTVRVKEILSSSSQATISLKMVKTEDYLYFTDRFGYTTSVYATNGTGLSTIYSINNNISIWHEANLEYVINDSLYFKAPKADGQLERFITNGTTYRVSPLKNIDLADYLYTGTVLLYASDDMSLYSSDLDGNSEVVLDMTNVYAINPMNFIKIGAETFFTSGYGDFSMQLWKTDGTPAGTMQLTENSEFPNSGSEPTNFQIIDDTLFFTATDSVISKQYYLTDTNDIPVEYSNASLPAESLQLGDYKYYISGKYLIRRINNMPDTVYTSTTTLEELTILNDKMYFIDRGENPSITFDDDIIMSDGNSFWSFNVDQKFTPSSAGYLKHLSTLHTYNDTLYFLLSDPFWSYSPTALWSTTGELDAGEVQITKLFSKTTEDIKPGSLTNFNNSLYMIFNEKSIYFTNDTISGAIPIPSFVNYANIEFSHVFNDRLLFFSPPNQFVDNFYTLDTMNHVVRIALTVSEIPEPWEDFILFGTKYGELTIINKQFEISTIEIDNSHLLQYALPEIGLFVAGNTIYQTDGTQSGTFPLTNTSNIEVGEGIEYKKSHFFKGKETGSNIGYEPYYYTPVQREFNADPARNLLIEPGDEAGSIKVLWENGTGDGRVVLVKEGAYPQLPFDSTAISGYSEAVFGDSIFHAKDTLTYLLDGSASDSLLVTGLSGNKYYYFSVVEYQTNGTIEYGRLDALSGSIYLEKYEQEISFSNPDTIFVGDTIILNVSSSTSNQIDLWAESNYSLIANIYGDTMIARQSGQMVIVARIKEDHLYQEKRKNDTIYISRKTPEIDYLSGYVFQYDRLNSIKLEAQNNTGNNTIFTLLSGPATISGSGSMETTGIGIVKILLNTPQTGIYEYGKDTIEIEIRKADTDIAFNEDYLYIFENMTYRSQPSLSNTVITSNGGGVKFFVAEGDAEINESNTISFTNTGTVIIGAYNTGNEYYNSSDTIYKEFEVDKEAQSIFISTSTVSWPYGTPYVVLQGESTFGLPVEYYSPNDSLVNISNDTVYILNSGSVELWAFHPGNENYMPTDTVKFSMIIYPIRQEISFENLESTVYLADPLRLRATSTSGLPVLFKTNREDLVQINGDTLSILGAGNAEIIAYQNGSRNYLEAFPVTQKLFIDRATQSIDFKEIDDISIDSASFFLEASASSGLALTFYNYDPDIISVDDITHEVTLLSVGSTLITAVQSGNENFYMSDEVNRTINVVNKDGLLVEGQQLLQRILVYPNPFDKFIHVVSEKSIKQVMLYNITGKAREILRPDQQKLIINLAHIESGIYYLKIETEDGLETFKILKK